MQDALAPRISLNSTLRLHPLSRQVENGVAIVGRNGQFLELPPEGLQFLDWLNEGLTLDGARKKFEEAFTPFPDEDLFDFTTAFLECDFVAAVDGVPLAATRKPPKADTNLVPQALAQKIFSKPILIFWMVYTIPAAALWISHPVLWPRRADYFWSPYYSLIILVGMLLWLGGMALHETAHFLAARAKGIDATVTWTYRLGFFPMSQTVMHNIWAIPRTARFLPLAAGLAWDVFVISSMVYTLYAVQMGVLVLPIVVVSIIKFYLLVLTMGVTSQFWLFSRMDGYYLLSAIFGQRNLQADTFTWLRSLVDRRVKFTPPAGGMKYIYLYALIAIGWGGAFMIQFLTINLPVKIQLVWHSWLKVINGANIPAIDFADGLGVFVGQVLYWGLLLYAHVREAIPKLTYGHVTPKP